MKKIFTTITAIALAMGIMCSCEGKTMRETGTKDDINWTGAWVVYEDEDKIGRIDDRIETNREYHNDSGQLVKSHSVESSNRYICIFSDDGYYEYSYKEKVKYEYSNKYLILYTCYDGSIPDWFKYSVEVQEDRIVCTPYSFYYKDNEITIPDYNDYMKKCRQDPASVSPDFPRAGLERLDIVLSFRKFDGTLDEAREEYSRSLDVVSLKYANSISKEIFLYLAEQLTDNDYQPYMGEYSYDDIYENDFVKAGIVEILNKDEYHNGSCYIGTYEFEVGDGTLDGNIITRQSFFVQFRSKDNDLIGQYPNPQTATIKNLPNAQSILWKQYLPENSDK